MFKHAQRICVFTIATAGLFAQTVTTAPTEETRTSGVIGIAEGQIARFNVLNADVSGPACSAVLTYYDGKGAALKSSTVSVAPGATGYLDLFSDADLALPGNQRKEIRATFSVPLVARPATSSAAKERPVCRLAGTLEIFDALTGRTNVVLGRMHLVRNEPVTPAPAN